MINLSPELMFLHQVSGKISEVMIVQNGNMAAAAANQVMVWLFSYDLIYSRTPNLGFADHLQLMKKSQRAINCGPIDGWGLKLNTFINLIDTGMTTYSAQSIQDKFSLWRKAIAKITYLLSVI